MQLSINWSSLEEQMDASRQERPQPQHDQTPASCNPIQHQPQGGGGRLGTILPRSRVSWPACHLPSLPASGLLLLTWPQIAHEKEKSDTKALLLASFQQHSKHKGQLEKISNFWWMLKKQNQHETEWRGGGTQGAHTGADSVVERLIHCLLNKHLWSSYYVPGLIQVCPWGALLGKHTNGQL